MLSHSGDRRVSERAQNDTVHPALEVMSDVAELLAGIDAGGCLIDKERMTAQAGDAGLEGQPSAQGWFLKEHHHLFAGEGSAEIRWTILHQRRKVEDRVDSGGTEIVDRDQVLSPGLRQGQRNGGNGLHRSSAHCLLPSATSSSSGADCVLDFGCVFSNFFNVASSACKTSSMCFLAIVYGGRKRNEVSCVRLMMMPRSSIAGTTALASSLPSSSADIISPRPRTSRMDGCFFRRALSSLMKYLPSSRLDFTSFRSSI